MRQLKEYKYTFFYNMLKFERFSKSQQKDVPCFTLNKGDVFISSGKHFAFERLPKGARNVYAICLEDGKQYRVSKQETFNIIGKYTFPKAIQDTTCDRENLKPGDLFVIVTPKNDAKLFRFERSNEKTVVGINVITGGKVKIDNRFRFVKLENIKH